jgi:uncharacterized membrane protein YdbT with pleckstrin-like domain
MSNGQTDIAPTNNKKYHITTKLSLLMQSDRKTISHTLTHSVSPTATSAIMWDTISDALAIVLNTAFVLIFVAVLLSAVQHVFAYYRRRVVPMMWRWWKTGVVGEKMEWEYEKGGGLSGAKVWAWGGGMGGKEWDV